MTTVISVRGRDRAALLADPNFVYVGRRCAGWPESIWGNPFKVAGKNLVVDFGKVRGDWWGNFATIDPSMSTVERVVDLYRQWVQGSEFLRDKLPDLRGKTLGCWCGCWTPGEPEIVCHAVVLAKLADGPMESTS